MPSPHPNSKKRRRSQSQDQDGHGKNKDNTSATKTASMVAASSTSSSSNNNIVPYTIQWLEKRKKKIPHALTTDNNGVLSPSSSSAIIIINDIDSILNILPDLRERERRALVRHIEKCINNKKGGVDGSNSNAKIELEGSDGEYDIGDSTHNTTNNNCLWPTNVEFSNNYKWDPTVPPPIKDKYSPPNNKTRQRAHRHSNRVYFRKITDQDHPACGEFGLYCAIDHATPGMWLLDYVGHVMLGENQDKESDYVSDFGEKSELACDANGYGNEARFLNDFRNTGKHPNVEFNTRRDKNGELRQGVYVKLKKDSKTEGFDGIRRGEELLVSYGKSYWRSRVGNLTDFVWRMPGRPMPEGGKPTT